MYNPDVFYSTENFIVTMPPKSIVSRKANIQKSSALDMALGHCYIGHNTTIRADLAPIKIHKYTFIEEGTTLRPCRKLGSETGEKNNDDPKHIKLTIGSHCAIGKNCMIEAAVIGMGCTIGNDCHISSRCVLKDFVRVESGTVVPDDMVLPPFSVVAGNPAMIVAEVPEGAATLIPIERVSRFKALKQIKTADNMLKMPPGNET